MFEKYTEKARRVIFFALHEATALCSPLIETEHILLGLLREDSALSSRILRDTASVESIRERIGKCQPTRILHLGSIILPLSDESKRALAHAGEEAGCLASKHIGTEHLLLGLLREEKSLAAEILRECQFELSKFRDELSRKPAEPE